MQTTFYLTTTCTSKNCNACLRKHGTCPVDAETEGNEEVTA
ncbi:hypothetical protein [Geomonas subterranea]|nr:hypothetical protein [Geomonas fuzhouensis]